MAKKEMTKTTITTGDYLYWIGEQNEELILILFIYKVIGRRNKKVKLQRYDTEFKYNDDGYKVIRTTSIELEVVDGILNSCEHGYETCSLATKSKDNVEIILDRMCCKEAELIIDN